MEVVSRDESGGRFDMPVPWKNIEKIGIPLAQDEAAAIINFHSKLEETIDPVIRRLWSEDETNVAASGFLINQPGSSNQIWHRDGPNDGLINVFCPLVDLTAEIGPTQVWSKTHLREISSDSDSRQSAPLMKRGQMPLMDYRTFHRGLGNISRDRIRTLAYAVYHRGSSSLGDMLGYGLLPKAYRSIKKMGMNIEDAREVFFSVSITSEVDEWPKRAAILLLQHGVCILHGANLQCKKVNNVAITRLADLQKRITNRGIDPSGKDGPFQFKEIASRDEGGGRLDMPVSWKCADAIDSQLPEYDAMDVAEFHSQLQGVVEPVLCHCWPDESHHVSASGFVVNEPGSNQHQWHRDGSEEGTINIFCPLADQKENCGPTEVWPNSHIQRQPQFSASEFEEKVAPLLKQGHVMLLDSRTLRQSMGNEMTSKWTVCYAVMKAGLRPRGTATQTNGLTLEYD